MGMKGRVLAVLAGVIVIAAVAVTAAFGAHKADPGVTSSSILIGGTFPLTGVASLYKTIPAAEKAYFDYVNDHGGVNGRKITFDIKDDAYNPAQTVPLTQQLVEQDKVFAVFGSLGTAPNLATWSYLNQNKVPQVLIATGDSYWGYSYKKYPWTIGYQPDYPGEAKIYGKYIAAKMPNAKIGVLYQNDAYGKNYYAGLRVGLGAKKSQIVSAQSYDVTQTSLTQQILALKAAGADTFVDLRDCRRRRSLRSSRRRRSAGRRRDDRQQRLGQPGVHADRRGERRQRQRRDLDELPRLGDVRAAGEHRRREARRRRSSRSTHRRFCRASTAGDANVVYGLSVGVDNGVRPPARRQDPDARGADEGAEEPEQRHRPVPYPGIKLQTSARDNFPIEQEIMIKWAGGATGD